MRFNIGGLGADKPFRHPIVNQGFNRVWRVVCLATSNQTIFRVKADQN